MCTVCCVAKASPYFGSSNSTFSISKLWLMTLVVLSYYTLCMCWSMSMCIYMYITKTQSWNTHKANTRTRTHTHTHTNTHTNTYTHDTYIHATYTHTWHMHTRQTHRVEMHACTTNTHTTYIIMSSSQLYFSRIPNFSCRFNSSSILTFIAIAVVLGQLNLGIAPSLRYNLALTSLQWPSSGLKTLSNCFYSLFRSAVESFMIPLSLQFPANSTGVPVASLCLVMICTPLPSPCRLPVAVVL